MNFMISGLIIKWQKNMIKTNKISTSITELKQALIAESSYYSNERHDQFDWTVEY